MELTENLEPVFIFASILLGLILNNVEVINNISPSLITIFLVMMLFALFMDIPVGKIGESFSNTKFTATSLIINFMWTPLLGYFLASLLLKGNLDMRIGFLMLILTPCTDWYLIFTKMAKGNLALSMSLLPINLVLQIILLPIYLLIFFSSTNTLEIANLAYSLIVFIVLPFIMAQFVKILLKGRSSLEKITSVFSRCQTLFLCVAIFALFNRESSVLIENVDKIAVIFIPVLLFFVINCVVDYIISMRLNFRYEDYVSLTFTTLARNSPLALAIAVSSFPKNELIAITLVIGPLIELPVLYVVSKIALKFKKKYEGGMRYFEQAL